jgi:hypothetical protein
VILTIGNLHENQFLSVSGSGIRQNLPISQTKFVNDPVKVSFECELDSNQSQFQITPTVTSRTPEDLRELGVIILDILLEQISSSL